MFKLIRDVAIGLIVAAILIVGFSGMWKRTKGATGPTAPAELQGMNSPDIRPLSQVDRLAPANRIPATFADQGNRTVRGASFNMAIAALGLSGLVGANGQIAISQVNDIVNGTTYNWPISVGSTDIRLVGNKVQVLVGDVQQGQVIELIEDGVTDPLQKSNVSSPPTWTSAEEELSPGRHVIRARLRPQPIATLTNPANGGQIGLNTLNARHHIEVVFPSNADRTTIDGDEIQISGTALVTIDNATRLATGAPRQVANSFIYQYPVENNFQAGTVTVTFAAGTWANTDGDLNGATTDNFTVNGANAAALSSSSAGRQLAPILPEESASVTLRVMAPSDPPAPIITQAANGLHADLVPRSGKTFPLFGQSPFLRLVGQNLLGGSKLQFFQTTTANGQTALAEIPNAKYSMVASPPGAWTAELNVPGSPVVASQNVLVMGVTNEGKHHYSAPFEYTIETPATLPKPVVTKVENPKLSTVNKVVTAVNDVYFVNGSKLKLTGDTDVPAHAQIVVYHPSNPNPIGTYSNADDSPHTSDWTVNIDGLKEGRQRLTVIMEQGDQNKSEPASITVAVRSRGPRVIRVEPANFGTAPGITALNVHFNPENPLMADQDAANYQLLGSNGSGVFNRGNESPLMAASPAAGAQNPKFDAGRNVVTIAYQNVTPDVYQLTVKGDAIKDIYGNTLEQVEGKPGANYVKVLGKAAGMLQGLTPLEFAEEPTVRPGITGSTGPYVRYQEYTEPREMPNGFNPSDRVESRVARLYYYRDAHRVVQIINRRAKSYNRKGVDMTRQLADKARQQADQRTLARKDAELKAIAKAQKTRQLEREMQNAENALNRTLQELTNASRQGATADDAAVQALQATATSFANKIDDLRGQVSAARDDEVAANELKQRLDNEETLAREEQFRREVAAGHADPDTYAAGKPKSDDPVEQVSVSVIGEGLIHLRGPIKGINVIRTMIDQIDAPVGQVRIGVHTIQVNGEHADRMEKVAGVMQQYIDHARFLTMQSAEMLRKAVVEVAARKAEEGWALYPGNTQEDRDHRYLYPFFGKDFIDELIALDSEFLRTGNKLLSLHSMDTTSLSSALNLMALAKNSTRQEILEQFMMKVQSELPAAEASYLEAGMTGYGASRRDARHAPKFTLLGENANFESLRGFFDTQIGHDETMTPLQREFIRLAQIFKSRLITEMELKQRVMERAIIEERLGNRMAELKAARRKEDDANARLEQSQAQIRKQQKTVLAAVTRIEQRIALLRTATSRWKQYYPTLQSIMLEYDRVNKDLAADGKPDGGKGYGQVVLPNGDTLRYNITQFAQTRIVKVMPMNVESAKALIDLLEACAQIADDLQSNLPRIKDCPSEFIDETNSFLKKLNGVVQDLQKEVEVLNQPDIEFNPEKFALSMIEVESFVNGTARLNATAMSTIQDVDNVLPLLRKIVELLFAEEFDIKELYSIWIHALEAIEKSTLIGWKDVAAGISEAKVGMGKLLETAIELEFAERNALRSRRPLDHKKLLDMLVDDLEEKYIELLSGTRAHTANIDNYLKRLTTALDDDYNTQFYFPAFRLIRNASTSWDVQFGQTETTTILANNREFAKVSPSATMEFDLPKRDILLKEAIDGGKALVQDAGALLNDPTFLAAAELSAPQSPATPGRGATGGQAVERSVIPGFGSDTAEQIISQNTNGTNQFGAALENLIPDPAIYKFETGTGFEIRPVIQPDGQAVVFDFKYLYSTDIREPVRADEKHLGRVKQHYIDTDVQLSNFELREVSRYQVALKASRTGRGVPGLENIPVLGALFRPLPSAESSLQQNLIYGQATIFPTLFDLMGLRWAPAVADLDPLRLSNEEFIVRGRHRNLENRVYDYSSSKVDEFLRIPESIRRPDLYRTQESVPRMHPNGYVGPGLDLQNSQMQEGYQPQRNYPQEKFTPSENREGAPFRPGRDYGTPQGMHRDDFPLEEVHPRQPNPQPLPAPRSSLRLQPADGSNAWRPQPHATGVQQAGYYSPTPQPRITAVRPLRQRR